MGTAITSPPAREFSVLVVDDDDVAAEGVMRSVVSQNITCKVVTAEDGLEALEIMRANHPKKSISSPFLVLLDLNMPRMDGFQFLKAVRADPDLHNTVVFILTTSSREADRVRAYQENAAGYMVKSQVGPKFAKLATLLYSYGQSVVLPNRSLSIEQAANR